MTTHALGAAHKELGMGLPPEKTGFPDIDLALTNECSPANAREAVAEVARWEIKFPVADASIPTTFGNQMNVWGTADGQPPAGVAAALNTLGTPGLLPGDFIIFGWRIRVLTEPETRRIPGNLYTPPTGSLVLPGSADAWTLNDLARALNVPPGQQYLQSEYLFGLPTWRFAYALIQAYEAVWLINHQDTMWKEPLTQCAYIEPFAEAEAAGLAYTTNQDKILELNRQMAALGQPGIFLPEKFTRIGAAQTSTVDGLNAGIFTPTRADDAAATIFGGIGVPQDALQKRPYLYSAPIFWPRGQPITFRFQVNANTIYQAVMQRWLSVTGGTGGIPGLDLNLPFSDTLAGVMPSALGADTMLEQTDDPVPVLTGQQVQTNQALTKGGTAIVEVSLLGKRVPPTWRKAVARAIAANAIQMPVGPGDLGSLIDDARSATA